MSRTVLITGATGKQGGSLVAALLKAKADFEVLAVTRDASSGGAHKLQAKSPNIKLVEGNLDEPERIFDNAHKVTSHPIWGVFSVQVPVAGGSNQEAEERQGKALVDAALKNNVKHFVYSSVDRGGDSSFDSSTPIPHFISKHKIEHHLVEKAKGSGMTWTILRPVAFLENFTPDFFGKVFATCWKNTVKEKPLQLISVGDIGFFGAQAFMYPNQYQNRGVSLAGDELTYDEMAKIFMSKTGKSVPMTFGFVGKGLMAVMKDFGYMFQWFYDMGYGADISELRKVHPELKDFGTWLEKDSGFSTK
ncbi:hypothetical protein N7499_004516 [Penicillium canescens]|uniref:NmrA-like domain-containing protein n=1 Tax=Penicillium canescens TaxID=5083 RepID=A0AAD6IAY0_PENCN|nr:uncharacterized protein N7446_005135 [Penicillium canescens]KAJ6038331.1 hypothetical protein N7460_008102 [Penicillium canescens]KAJ6039552.1 hypothetical protein N7444_008457 [Penicillium canescens]KAJ6068098.1 hypothetical protein N7446_005135 [Penicillium canescens]KAJ6084887.1 hypothetical protein N7499_004516 [Penicillium canescens]KAJ6161672.1 hypothetical protein N7485_009902 [Penicillium canescens]